MGLFLNSALRKEDHEEYAIKHFCLKLLETYFFQNMPLYSMLLNLDKKYSW